jgi:hypothetical protein
LKRKERAFVLAQVVIVAVVLTLVSLPIQSLNQTSSSSSRTTSSSATSTVASSSLGQSPSESTSPSVSPLNSSGLGSNGLLLSAAINASSFEPGDSLQITVSLKNALSTVNTVEPSNQSVLRGFPIAVWGSCIDIPVGSPVSPMDFIVVSGNYSPNSLKALAANAMSAGGGVGCPEDSILRDITFLPNSDLANLTGEGVFGYNDAALGSFALSSNFTINGYWEYPLTVNETSDGYYSAPGGEGVAYAYSEVGPVAAHLFVPGVYTLAVEDDWGQLELLHFTVAPSSVVNACLVGPFSYSASFPSPSQIRTGGGVFNVTQQFDSWNWAPVSNVSLRLTAVYYFVISSSSSGGNQSHPDVTFSVKNGLGVVSSVTIADLGTTRPQAGEVWPPPLSPSYEESFFGGQVSISLLFPCGTQNVYLEVTTTPN